MALGRARPAAGRQHDGQRLVGHQVGGLDRLRRRPLDDTGATRVAVFLGIGDDLRADQLGQLRLAGEQRFDFLALRGQPRLLVANLHFLEFRQVPQLGLEDRLGLFVRELEALDQDRLGFLLAADDADHLVEIEVGNQHAVENVQPTRHLVEPEFEAPPHRAAAEFEPLGKQRLQAADARPAVERDDVDVDAVAALEIGGGEQVRHQLFDVDAVGARLDDQARGVLVIRFVADVLDHRQLLLAHLLRDLLLHAAAGHLERQLRDHDRAALLLLLPGGARPVAAGALLVEFNQLITARDDLGAGRQVGTLDVLEQRARGRVRVVEQLYAGGGDLAQVVRRNVGRHADRDAGRAIEQQVRQPRRQPQRLLQGAVEIGAPVDRAVGEFVEQQVGVARQARLGVAHRRERLRVVGRAPVALAVDQRIAVGKILRHVHHGFVAG